MCCVSFCLFRERHVISGNFSVLLRTTDGWKWLENGKWFSIFWKCRKFSGNFLENFQKMLENFPENVFQKIFWFFSGKFPGKHFQVLSGKFSGKFSRKLVENFLKIHHALAGATVASLKVTELHFYVQRTVTMTPTKRSIYFWCLTKFSRYDIAKNVVF